MATRAQAKQIKSIVSRRQVDCKVMTIGTGKHVQVGLHGPHAQKLAQVMTSKLGWHTTPMSGKGINHIQPITLDR